MNVETVTIVIAIVGTGIALVAVLLPGQRDLNQCGLSR